MTRRRDFGNVRALPSGRWQASYIGGQGLRVNARVTFPTKREAGAWLVLRHSEIVRGQVPELKPVVPFGPYAREWVEQRPGLRDSTRSNYRWQLKRYLLPTFEEMDIAKFTPASVRAWRSRVLSEYSGDAAAKGYRLLKAILATATDDDELLTRNPCRIRGGGTEHRAERPVLTSDEVFELVDLMPERYRLMVLLATFGSLRYGEVAALTRSDLNVSNCTVTVNKSISEVRGKGLVVGPPKSRAGRRTVALPSSLGPVIEAHLTRYALPGAHGLVFTLRGGSPVRRSLFNPQVKWMSAVAAIGREGLHFHDLRHTGNVMAAAAGVSTRDLMARMGHDSMQAALIYQHITQQADGRIASALDVLFKPTS